MVLKINIWHCFEINKSVEVHKSAISGYYHGRDIINLFYIQQEYFHNTYFYYLSRAFKTLLN